MEGGQAIAYFFVAIQKDARISITHIGFLAALVRYWQLQDGENPFFLHKNELMQIAKISSPTTYHKCVRDLHDFGYIRYEPCYKRNQYSKVYLFFEQVHF